MPSLATTGILAEAFNWRDAWIDEDFALNRWFGPEIGGKI